MAFAGIALILYVSGIRDGLQFLVLLFIASVAVRPTLTALLWRWFPPQLEMSGDFRGILHGVAPDVEDTDSPDSVASIDHPAVSTLDREHWTLESIVLRAVLTLVVLYVLWQFAGPIIKGTLGWH